MRTNIKSHPANIGVGMSIGNLRVSIEGEGINPLIML